MSKRKVASNKEAEFAQRAVEAAGFAQPEQNVNFEDDLAAMQDAGIIPASAQQIPQPPAAGSDNSSFAQEQIQSKEEKEEKKDPLEYTVEQIARYNPGMRTPTVETLKQWKATFGSIFMLEINETIFIYRYLNRQEWLQMNSEKSKETQKGLNEIQLDEQLMTKCLLWPQYTPEQLFSLPAGTGNMIAEQVRIRSMFLDPGFVVNMSIKL